MKYNKKCFNYIYIIVQMFVDKLAKFITYVSLDLPFECDLSKFSLKPIILKRQIFQKIYSIDVFSKINWF